MRTSRVPTAFVLVVALGGPTAHAELRPLGPEVVVNSSTSGSRILPVVAFEPGGGVVVTWQGEPTGDADSSGDGIRARRFAPGGAPLGPEFLVNGYTPTTQSVPSVAVAPSGETVFAWGSGWDPEAPEHSHSIRLQGFAADGSRLGAEIAMPASTRSDSPAIAFATSGELLLTWTDAEVAARRFGPSGDPLGAPFQVNSFATAYQGRPDIALARDGGFVITWESYGSFETDDDRNSIQLQRFGATGTPIGPQRQVNVYTARQQRAARVAALPSGDFAVVWGNVGSNPADRWFSIEGRIVSSDGTPRGGEFLVNSYTSSYQLYPAVAAGDRGGFVVVWDSAGSGGDDQLGSSIQAREFGPSGKGEAGQIQVNERITGSQFLPRVAAGPAGRFAVVWVSQTASYGDYDIHLRGFESTLLFSDGFELGDLGSWSASVGGP